MEGGGWHSRHSTGSAPVTLLDVTQGSSLGPLTWAPDGQAIDVVRPPGDRVALSDQWPPGVCPDCVFRSAITRSFAWSPDGRRLLLSRGENKADVVLFKRSEGR